VQGSAGGYSRETPVNRRGGYAVFRVAGIQPAFTRSLAMKRSLFILALLTAAPAMAADVSVSVDIGDPRFYGQIHITSYPQPRLIYPTPIVIHAIPVGVVRAPMYLRVPPGHVKHWDRHCAEYNACGFPVYFVEDDWYNTVYVPEYKARHGHNGKGKDKDKGKKKNKD
jgi:hypothetical protein